MLGLAISQLLHAQVAQGNEGELSRRRAHLVRETSLHAIALQLGLAPHLRLSEGEAKGGGAQRASILADALEAVFGAIHLDAGFDAAAAVVARLFAPLLAADAAAFGKDPKTSLQEWLQARRHAVPSYRIVATHGQAHRQHFEVECAIAALALRAVGEGGSRRAAEQAAAARVLAQLPKEP